MIKSAATTKNNGGSSSSSVTVISFEDWISKYKPLVNPAASEDEYSGFLFHPRTDFEKVSRQPEEKVWTLIECDNLISIVQGIHWVNREGYFITEVGLTRTDAEIEVRIHSLDDELDHVLSTFRDSHSIQITPEGCLLLKDAHDPSDSGELINPADDTSLLFSFNIGVVSLQAQLNRKSDRAFITGTMASGRPSRRITIMLEKAATRI